MCLDRALLNSALLRVSLLNSAHTPTRQSPPQIVPSAHSRVGVCVLLGSAHAQEGTVEKGSI